MINCQIGWDSRLLTGLTRLTLVFELPQALNANTSINQFLHALQRMPALTDLLIGSISDDLEGSSPYPVVDLPRLWALSISSGVGALTAVLRNITFPHSAILELTCKKNKSTQIDFSNFLSVLATKFLSSLIFRSLSLQAAIDGLEFCLWTTAIIHDCFPISDPQLKLLLTWPTPYSPVHVKALTCAFDAMSLPFLIQLKISTSDCIVSRLG